MAGLLHASLPCRPQTMKASTSIPPTLEFLCPLCAHTSTWRGCDRAVSTYKATAKTERPPSLPCFLLPIPLAITLTVGGSTQSHDPPKKKKEKRCVVCVCSVLGWGVSTLALRQARGESTWWLAWVGSHLIPPSHCQPRAPAPPSSSSCAGSMLVCVGRECVGSA